MTKVRFLKKGRWAHPTNVRAPLIEVLEPGQVLEVDDAVAEAVIGAGSAEPVAEPRPVELPKRGRRKETKPAVLE